MPTHCYLFQFVLLCLNAQGPTTYMHTEVFKKTQVNTPKTKKEPLCDRGTSMRDLHVVFRPVFKGCNCALTLSLDQWLSNLLPCCA